MNRAGPGDLRIPVDHSSLDIDGTCEAVITGIDSEAFKLGASGDVEATLTGQARELLVNISGNAEITAHELAAKSVTVAIAGNSDVTVHATETLDVGISGDGTVRYVGDPTVTKNVTGSGTVEKRE